VRNLRNELIDVALRWECAFGNVPHITAAVAELDAAQMVGCSLDEYSRCMQTATAVQRGFDFQFNGKRYQVKANRPSGKAGSFVTLVPKARNFCWDFLVWILYDELYAIQEAWLWDVESYQAAFTHRKRLSPVDYRAGVCLG
jgi:hypothetical protein